jgi:hypothetical protein
MALCWFSILGLRYFDSFFYCIITVIEGSGKCYIIIWRNYGMNKRKEQISKVVTKRKVIKVGLISASALVFMERSEAVLKPAPPLWGHGNDLCPK